MTRSQVCGFIAAISLALFLLPAAAQTAAGVPGSSAPSASAPGSNAPGSTAPGNRRGRQQPCWQVAGISQQTVQEHRQIEEKTRSEVESVCANSSLSPQQKREQVRQLREQGRKQMEALITPQQEEALKSCREQRGGERENRGMHRGGGEGGCGELPAGNGSANGTKPQPQNQTEPDER